MNKLPLVSVIIPCYNSEKFVEQAVRSIMEQTYKNLEIIVINDCSTDNTKSILQSLAKEDSRIIYIENEYNIKLPKTLNKGLSVATGKYIARMDSDDISHPNRIEEQVLFLAKNPLIDIVGSNAQIIDELGNITKKQTIRKISHFNIISELPYKCPFTHPSILAKKTFFTDVGEFKSISYAEDYEYWIRAWQKGKKFANHPNVLLYYRVHKNQMSGIEYNYSNSLEIRKFLFYYFWKTKNYKFLLGILLHTKIFSIFINKTYKIRKLIIRDK